MSDDLISRQAAIDALNGNITVTGEENAKAIQEYIRSVSLKIHDLPSAQPQTVIDQLRWERDIAVKQLHDLGYEFGEEPSAQPEEDCDTCKHGYFGDDQCNNCRVRYPSHYERRTDE